MADYCLLKFTPMNRSGGVDRDPHPRHGGEDEDVSCSVMPVATPIPNPSLPRLYRADIENQSCWRLSSRSSVRHDTTDPATRCTYASIVGNSLTDRCRKSTTASCSTWAIRDMDNW